MNFFGKGQFKPIACISVTIVGYAAFLALMCIVETSPVFATTEVQPTLYFIRHAMTCVSVVLVCLFGSRKAPKQTQYAIMVTCSIVLPLSIVPLANQSSQLVLYCANAVMGLVSGPLWVGWWIALMKEGSEAFSRSVLVSFCLAAVISLVAAFSLPYLLVVAIVLALSVASAVILLMCLQLFTTSSTAPSAVPSEDVCTPAFCIKETLSVKAGVYIVVTLLFVQLMQSIFPVSNHPSDYVNPAALIAVPLEIFLLGAVGLILKRTNGSALSKLQLGIVFLLGVNIFLLAFKVLWAFPIALNAAGRFVFIALLQILLAEKEFRTRNVVGVVAVGLASMFLGMSIADILGAVFHALSAFDPRSFEIRVIIAFVTIFIFMVLVTFLSPRDKPNKTSVPAAISEADASVEARCVLLASQIGLTPRETEVLTLLAHGRSVPYIEGNLVLSKNTVKTHVKHIYQKAGVSTKQELITLIDSTKAL